MTLQDYLRIISRRRLMIVNCVVLALAAAAAFTLRATPIYEASVQLFVSAQAGPVDTTSAQQGSLFAQDRVKSYADILGSPDVTGPVVQDLGLHMSPDTLASKISADAPLNTVLLNIHVKDPSPALAQRAANAVADQFVQLVDQLETPEGSTTSTVKVSIIRRADLPNSPVSPRTKLDLILGGIVGIVIGIGGAVLRDTLDTSLKDPEDVQERFGLANIGLIPFDEDAPTRPLIVQGNKRSPRAEAFRQLRTNLQFVDVDQPPRSIVVTSPLPGDGKTATAVNLALALAESGRPVVLVGGDLRKPELAERMGVEGSVGLTDVLVGRVNVLTALQSWGTGAKLQILPAGAVPPNPSELLGSQQMRDLLRILEMHGLVIIDAPPLLPVTDAALLTAAASGALVVVRAGKTRREQLRRALESLQSVGGHVYGGVVNMIPTKGPGGYYYGDYGKYYGRTEKKRRGRKAAAAEMQAPAAPGSGDRETVSVIE